MVSLLERGLAAVPLTHYQEGQLHVLQMAAEVDFWVKDQIIS